MESKVFQDSSPNDNGQCFPPHNFVLSHLVLVVNHQPNTALPDTDSVLAKGHHRLELSSVKLQHHSSSHFKREQDAQCPGVLVQQGRLASKLF